MKKPNRRVKFVTLVFLGLAILLLAGTASAQSVNTYTEVVEGVVRISQRNPVTDTWFNAGTGFVIGDNPPFRYVATNWFNICPRPQTNNQQWDIAIRLFADHYVPTRIHIPLQTTDIVILELTQGNRLHTHRTLQFSSRDDASVGQTVYAIGWPDISFTDYDTSYASDVTVTRGVISRNTVAPQGSPWAGTKWWQHDASINLGNTGGPLVNEQGHVVGINTFMVGAAQGHGIMAAIHVDYLTEVLSSSGIAFTRAAPSAPDPAPAPAAPEPTPAPVPIPVTVPVQAPIPVPVTVTQPQVVTGPQAQNSGPNYLVIGGIGLGTLALVGIILAVALSGRNTAPALPAPPVRAALPHAGPPPQVGTGSTAPVSSVSRPAATPGETQARQMSPRPVIKGISGRFTGQSIEMVGGRLSIGRDPSMAQLVYPQNEADISRKHCTITFDEKTQRFILEDSSSNGTFLASNQKLNKNKPYYLNPGSRFYLVDSKEMFMVSLD